MPEPTFSGGCLCGAIRYEASGTPFDITHCHCEDCRRSAGAPFVTWASFLRKNVHFSKGAPRIVHWANRVRSFCPDCGTQLTFATALDSEVIDVTVCSFDDPATATPCDHTWIEDRLRWVHLADGLPTYERIRML